MKKQWDDHSAVNDIRAGKQEGATYLYNQYEGRLRGVFKKWFRGLSDDDAEDILQETFIRFINHVRKASPENISAYLFTIGKHECCRFIEKKQLLSSQETTPFKQNNDDEMCDDVDDLNNVPSDIDIEREVAFLDCFAKALKKFEKKENNADQCFSILTLMFEGWSLKEIADKIDRTYGATREFFSQCRKKLKPYVEDCLKHNR